MFDIFNMLKKDEPKARTGDRETIIGDILDMDQTTAPYFMEIGMHCLGCPASRGESIEEACAVHGVDCDELIEKLNEHLACKEGINCCPHWMRVWLPPQSLCAPESRWRTSAATTAS